MGTIREPVKRTSIEKKNRIIEKGFELICEKGFHNITCVDIAKYAGVSTGIIYQYFKDKEDIFVHGIRVFANSILFPVIGTLQSFQITPENIDAVMEQLIMQMVKNHQIAEDTHEELFAMMHSNSDIRKLMTELEYEATNKIVQILMENGFQKDGLKEKIHLIYNMVDEFCHEIVYHKHPEMDEVRMRQEVIRVVHFLLCL